VQGGNCEGFYGAVTGTALALEGRHDLARLQEKTQERRTGYDESRYVSNSLRGGIVSLLSV
jgi:hypothetical protein